MADGYARISGRPGVCFVITGPGLTNIATPMGQAYSDSVPMLVISTVRATADLERQWGRLHEISDQRSVSEPLCAFAATAMTPDEVPELIDRAYAVFESERPRPVHIEIPLDVAAMPVEGDWMPADPVTPPQPDPADISAAVDELRKAKMPVIVAGGGALDGAEDLVRLAESLAAPVITTTATKGMIAEDHPLNLGCTLANAETQKYLEETDILLAVGTELSETETWRDDIPLPEKIIRVDIDPYQINNPYPSTTGIIGDACASLKYLADQLAGSNAPDAEMAEQRVRAIRQAARSNETDLMKTHRKVLEVMGEALPDETAVVTDMTQIAYSGNEIYPVHQTRSWLHPTGFGTLGYALPAAIGAKLAVPSRPITALAGDFGFQFTLPELAVAAELDLHLTLILWNNDALGQIRDDMYAQGIGKIGVEHRNPDFALLAESYRARYARPDNAEDLKQALLNSQEEPGLWFIEVRQAAFS